MLATAGGRHRRCAPWQAQRAAGVPACWLASLCRRAGVPACRRAGVSASRCAGMLVASLCQRAGVQVCCHAGCEPVPACRRVPVPASRRAPVPGPGVPAPGRAGVRIRAKARLGGAGLPGCATQPLVLRRWATGHGPRARCTGPMPFWYHLHLIAGLDTKKGLVAVTPRRQSRHGDHRPIGHPAP